MSGYPQEGDGELCAHCRRPATGLAGANGKRLCHGDGRDCYQQVTVYRLPLGQPCNHRSPLHCKCIDPATVHDILRDALRRAPHPTLLTEQEWAKVHPGRTYPGPPR